MLANPQTKQLLEDTTVIAGSTTRFTQATSRFSDATSEVADASNRFANTVEHFRQELPAQQSQLMDQLNKIVATQSQAALHQASTQATALTGATVTQLNSTVTAQQDLLTQHLQAVMDSSIDRLYWRLRALVLIVGGTCVGAIVLYRLIAAIFFRSTSRRP